MSLISSHSVTQWVDLTTFARTLYIKVHVPDALFDIVVQYTGQYTGRHHIDKYIELDVETRKPTYLTFKATVFSVVCLKTYTWVTLETFVLLNTISFIVDDKVSDLAHLKH